MNRVAISRAFSAAGTMSAKGQIQMARHFSTVRPLLFKASQPKQLLGDEVPNPAAVPKQEPNRMKGSYHWMNERAVSVITIPLLATAFIYGSHPINDMLMGIVIPVHGYMGFQQALYDYFEKRRWPKVGRILKGALMAVTGLSMFGAWRINTTDVGLTNYFSRLWNANKLKKQQD